MDVPVRKLPFKPSDCFQNITGLLYTLKPFSHPFIYWKLCGMWCAPAIFVQLFCFLLHSSVPVLGFSYRKALELYRILDHVTRVTIPLLINRVNRFSRFPQKVAQGTRPGYFTPAFSIMYNFCFRLSIHVEQTVSKTLIPCYQSAVQICFKNVIYNPKFCVQRL